MGHLELSWVISGYFKLEARASRLEPWGWGLGFLSYLRCLEFSSVILRHFGSFEVILGQFKSLGFILNHFVVSLFKSVIFCFKLIPFLRE